MSAINRSTLHHASPSQADARRRALRASERGAQRNAGKLLAVLLDRSIVDREINAPGEMMPRGLEVRGRALKSGKAKYTTLSRKSSLPL